MKNFSILIIYIFLWTNAHTDVCSDQSCPKGRKETAICFSDPNTSGTGIWRASAVANCGYFTNIIVTTDLSKIKSELNNLVKSCKSLNRATFYGHGNDGHLTTGNLDQGSIQELNSYACLFNKNAEIQYYGCNVGRGCSGDMLLFQTANSLLKRGGTVTAPSFYAATILPGVVPHFSLNGKSRLLKYDPAKRPPDSCIKLDQHK